MLIMLMMLMMLMMLIMLKQINQVANRKATISITICCDKFYLFNTSHTHHAINR